MDKKALASIWLLVIALGIITVILLLPASMKVPCKLKSEETLINCRPGSTSERFIRLRIYCPESVSYCEFWKHYDDKQDCSFDFHKRLWTLNSGESREESIRQVTEEVSVTRKDFVCVEQCPDGSFHYKGECPAEKEIPKPEQPEPSRTIGEMILQAISNFIQQLLSFFNLASIGSQQASPGSTISFDVKLQTDIDSDYLDGKVQYQYAGWALYDENLNVVQQSDWESVNGIYEKNIVINAPQKPGKYALVVVIYQYDMQYVDGEWKIVNEDVVVKEGHTFVVTYSAPQPPTPSTSTDFFVNMVHSFLDWIKNLFRGAFNWV